MAVQFADKALDEWLTKEIEKLDKSLLGEIGGGDDFDHGYLSALRETQQQLHEFWVEALKYEENQE